MINIFPFLFTERYQTSDTTPNHSTPPQPTTITFVGTPSAKVTSASYRPKYAHLSKSPLSCANRKKSKFAMVVIARTPFSRKSWSSKRR